MEQGILFRLVNFLLVPPTFLLQSIRILKLFQVTWVNTIRLQPTICSFIYRGAITAMGIVFTQNQPDVRFAKVPVNGPGSVLTFFSSTLDDSSKVITMALLIRMNVSASVLLCSIKAIALLPALLLFCHLQHLA